MTVTTFLLGMVAGGCVTVVLAWAVLFILGKIDHWADPDRMRRG